MTTLNSDNIVNVPPTIVDPNAFLPPGVEAIRYGNADDTEPTVVETPEGEFVAVDYNAPLDLNEPLDFPPSFPHIPEPRVEPPTTVTVVSQNLFVSPDSKFAVDVILEVEDIFGVKDFEVRVSKS